MTDAIRTIKAEHRTLDKVMRVLDTEIKAFRELGDLDLELFLTIVEYIESYPDEIHHPKEERYLFSRIVERAPEAADLVARLRREHEDLARLIKEIKVAAKRLALEEAQDKPALAALVGEYTALMHDHMRREEMELIPLLREKLDVADRAEIDRQFAADRDPLEGGEGRKRYGELLRRIIYLSEPPPLVEGD